MSELVHSDITGCDYNPKNVVRILNNLQACKYIKSQCYPVDIYPSIDLKTGQDVLVFIFDRDQTKELYSLWLKHEL